jgi:hypothetical protein
MKPFGGRGILLPTFGFFIFLVPDPSRKRIQQSMNDSVPQTLSLWGSRFMNIKNPIFMVTCEIMVADSTNSAPKWICQYHSLYHQLHFTDKYIRLFAAETDRIGVARTLECCIQNVPKPPAILNKVSWFPVVPPGMCWDTSNSTLQLQSKSFKFHCSVYHLTRVI